MSNHEREGKDGGDREVDEVVSQGEFVDVVDDVSDHGDRQGDSNCNRVQRRYPSERTGFSGGYKRNKTMIGIEGSRPGPPEGRG